ncbi:MAG TPA: hypothetical protein VEC37_19870, partial [Bacillota bacterium]|nr:hypothetical protein [Bacillota bacterium]
MSNENWFNGENILKNIKEDSKKRRANPLACFCDFLEAIWMDNTAEEALFQWKVKVEQFPWYADDALYCINEVTNNPPLNLIELMQKHGWLYLCHQESPNEEPFTYEEYLEWLKKLHDQYQAIYDNAPVHEDGN